MYRSCLQLFVTLATLTLSPVSLASDSVALPGAGSDNSAAASAAPSLPSPSPENIPSSAPLIPQPATSDSFELRPAKITFESIDNIPVDDSTSGGARFRLANVEGDYFVGEQFGALVGLNDIAIDRFMPESLGAHSALSLVIGERPELSIDATQSAVAPPTARVIPSASVDLWTLLLVGLGLIYYQMSRRVSLIKKLQSAGSDGLKRTR